jgi:hypothetical protein
VPVTWTSSSSPPMREVQPSPTTTELHVTQHIGPDASIRASHLKAGYYVIQVVYYDAVNATYSGKAAFSPST